MNAFSLIGRSQKRWNQNIFSTSSSKSAPCPSVILTCSSGNRALATVLCAFCRQLSPIEPRTRGNRDPLLRRPRQPLYRKKTQGFAPESVFKPEFRRSRSLTLPNYLMMMLLSWWCGWPDDWHDDVVAMMVRKLAMTIVRNSEVS